MSGGELRAVVSSEFDEYAEQRFLGLASFVLFAGSKLPFPADRLVVICAARDFHHFDPSAHVELPAELRRTLRPGGKLFVFEHNPLAVRAVKSCPSLDVASFRIELLGSAS